ncbi:MAG: serine hydrolase domain-containing protein [Pirellulaceae bacterium]
MRRRTFISTALALAGGGRMFANEGQGRWDQAADVLELAVKSKQVESAALFVSHRGHPFVRHFGKADSNEAMFLIASISKPINVAALMTLYDQGEFKLDDRVGKFLPEFQGEGRDKVAIRDLLTHVSGLPDQLPENKRLRKKHAPLGEFIQHAYQTPLLFEPRSRYRYSSMGILLAARIGEVISGLDMASLVDQRIFKPLGMTRSVQGLGQFKKDAMVACQVEGAAAESGSGDPDAKKWDWNSSYWRNLGAPWGGVHASASDIGLFLSEILGEQGKALKPQTARLMVQNHSPDGRTPRGLGFALGAKAGSPGCSQRTFGHSGATGTICWADAATETICVVLTSLPSTAAKPHPRELAAEQVAVASLC